MKDSRLRTLAEGVGVVAVVGSLIFVGLEIRQNAEATRAAAVEGVTGAWQEWSMEVGTDRAVWEAVDRVVQLEDYQAADPADLSVAEQVVSSMFVIWANAQYHSEEGLLNVEFWDANLRLLEGNFGDSGEWGDFVRWRWQQIGYAFPTSFQALVDSIQASSGAADGGR
jgi:hypothetical protein